MEAFIAVVLAATIVGLLVGVWQRAAARPQPEAPREAVSPRRTAAAPRATAQAEREVVSPPQFNLVAVGLPGAGKTLMLASVYHLFQAPANGRSYYLEAPRREATELNALFHTISNSSASWPNGTARGDFRRFHFTAAAPVRGGEFHRAFTIRYTEYAGELLVANSDDGSENEELLHRDIAEAHAVMALLDGYDVSRALEGDTDAGTRISLAVSTFVESLRYVRCSVNFAVTKWDLLQLTGQTDAELVGRVRRLLDSSEQFQWLVGRKDAAFTVRLFPISAVGPGFATPDASGHMVKRSAGTVNPTGVTLPFSSVIPDIFERAEALARAEAGGHDRAAEASQGRAHRSELRFGVLTSVLDQLSLVPGGALPLHILRWMTGVDPRLARSAGLSPDAAWLRNDDVEGGAGMEAARLILKEMRRETDAAEGALPEGVLRRVG